MKMRHFRSFLNTAKAKELATALSTHYHYVIFYFQTFGHNCARQRDKIPTLLEEFAIAQEEVILRCHIPMGKLWSTFFSLSRNPGRSSDFLLDLVNLFFQKAGDHSV